MDGALESCIDGRWQAAACPGLTRCDEGACLPPLCTPGEARCVDGRVRSVCNATGTRFEDEACAQAVCLEGACVAGCVPGARRCDAFTVLECGEDLVERGVLNCDPAAGEQCVDGRCATACEIAGKKRGHLGCDYWAADLPNDETAIDNIFAFAFSNASETRPAKVTVTYPWGPVETVTVPPGGLETHALPAPRWLSQIRAAGLSRQGFRIQSDLPIAAFMFNPLERYDADASASVATNDASILMPTPALGTTYVAMTWSDPGQYSKPPYVTVVATEDDTEVTVVSAETFTMLQSPFLVAADNPTTFTLQAHEVLNLEPAALPNLRTDMTGTRVEATKPVAVFSGNRCARVPDAGRFCDHIEKQLPPVEAWGTTFVAMKFANRGGESDYYRVIAREPGTVLTFDPPRTGVPTLGPGQVYEFSTRGDFSLSSSAPVLVGQFMASQSMTTPPGAFGVSGDCPWEIGGTCQGDPSMLIVAPVAQWIADPIFLVPDTYRHQFIAIAFEQGTTLTLDGSAVETATARPIGATGWRALTLPTSGGARRIVASAPVGVVAYGYDHNISYAYNGGLTFRRLAP
jgi:hypothetical protein